jgi:ClpP class serine protease
MKYDKTATGCRPAQLLGVWSIEPVAFESLYARAMEVLESDARYELVSRESREMVAEEREHPYQVDKHGIAHFQVEGPLTRYPTSMQSLTGGTSTMLFERALDKASADPDVLGAMLHVDSPGGHTAVMADVRAAIQRFRSSGKRIGAHGAGSMCSAAYGLSAECDTITSDPAAVVGSVGTMLVLRDTSEVMKRAGVKPIYITTGDRKAAAAPGTPISDDTIKDMNKFVADAGAGFRDQVKARRPQITTENMADVLRGGVYAGRAAKDIGLVDDVCDTTAAIERFKNELSSGSSVRALPAGSTTGAAQQGSTTMLTPEQLTAAKALPGCDNITEQTAEATLLAAAQKLNGDLTAANAAKTEQAASLASLESELTTLRTQTTPPPKGVLMAMATAARVHASSAVDKGAITPAVQSALAARLIGEGDNLMTASLVPDATGECIASRVFSALAANGRMPETGKDAGIQAAPKAVAGAPEGTQRYAKSKEDLLALSGSSATE